MIYELLGILNAMRQMLVVRLWLTKNGLHLDMAQQDVTISSLLLWWKASHQSGDVNHVHLEDDTLAYSCPEAKEAQANTCSCFENVCSVCMQEN